VMGENARYISIPREASRFKLLIPMMQYEYEHLCSGPTKCNTDIRLI
jgi:hypothetical protein